MKGFLGLDWLPSDSSKANAQRYEEWVAYELNLILSRWSGWCVLSEVFSMRRNGRTMSIKPYSPTPDDPLNAYAKPLDPQAATLKGAPQKFGGGPQAGKDIPQAPPGTGKGSDVEIRYTPWLFKPGIGGPVQTTRMKSYCMRLSTGSEKCPDYTFREPRPNGLIPQRNLLLSLLVTFIGLRRADRGSGPTIHSPQR